ncbi:regulator [Bosea sp. Root483D1]|uniref:response regulator n=1 Tax=Bosea sp. Root483D1 TaxID=1736544 RepID=UPI0007096367|nr:response regulator [Bosea sp. Root483D1]KRE11615.1 regulator [Bosea sp. Root483D1]
MPGLKPEDAEFDSSVQARILIVEDEFLIAMELEYRLMEAGIEVVGTAITAEEAIAIAKSEKPDLAIMDIRLAGRRDGVDAAIELYSTLGIRSIFASAHADTDTRSRAAPASPIGWLQKPYQAEELLRLLKTYYQNRDGAGDAQAHSE